MHTIGSLKFKTKKELETYTRGYLRDRLDKTFPKGSGEYGFLKRLIGRHPEFYCKVSSPIKSFRIHKNFGGHVALSFIDEEGEKSVSWKKCVNQNKSNWLADLKAVCRQEVVGQVQAYKDSNYIDGMNCPNCGLEIPNRKTAHVDHLGKSFKQIFSEFTGQNFHNLPDNFQSAGLHVGYEFRGEDWFIRKIWVDYHRDNAAYQILCASCNIRKK